MTEIPAGWYPDPYETPNLYRWWDGTQWSDHTAPMSPEQAQRPAAEPVQAQGPSHEQWQGQAPPQGQWQGQAAPQEQWQGSPSWEPQAEPPPWDTQHGPPGLDDRPGAGHLPEAGPQDAGPPEAGPPPLDPFVPRPQLPSDDDPTAAHGAQPWAAAETGWSPPEPDWGQPSHPDPDWGQEPAPVPPVESQGPGGWGAPPARGPEPGGPPPRKGRGLLVGGIAGGLALLLIVGVLVGVFFVRRGGDQRADSSPSTSPSAAQSTAQSTAPSSTQPASPAPTGPRITAGQISYVQLKAPWEPNDQLDFDEFDTKKGQYQYTQRNPPGVEGGWIANVYIGSLSDQFSYGGPEDLQSTATGLASSVEQKYYKPWKTKRKNLEQKKITVGDRQGYEIKFHLDFLNTPKGFAAKGETVLVAVVDGSTGGQGVYISIPDNAKKLEPTFDLVMNSLQVE